MKILRREFSNLAKNMMILVVGGCSEGMELGCHSSVEATSNIFHPFEPYTNGMNRARRGPAIIQTGDGSVAVIGGCSQPAVHLNDMVVMRQNQWKSAHLDLAGFSCAAYCQLGNEHCFIAGGYNGRECLNQVQLVSSSQHTVSNLKPLSSPLKNASALAIEGGTSVLLFGGWDEKRTLNTVFEYSLSDQTCSLTNLMPGAVEGHTVTQTSARFAYVIGGYDGIGLSNNICQFDIQSRSFTQMEEKLLIARENHATVVYVQDWLKYLVVMGGWDGLKALDSCEVFRVMDEEPYLEKVKDHRLVLDSPRNKLAAIVVPIMQKSNHSKSS